MAARFWRLFFPNHSSGTVGVSAYSNNGNIYVCCVGVQMRAQIGGPNIIPQIGSGDGEGEAFASSIGSSTAVPSNAFLPYFGNRRWETGRTTFPHWVGYAFQDPVDVEEITMTGVDAGSAGTTMPHRIILQYSDEIDGPWTQKYAWQVDVWPWRLDGSDTRIFNANNAVRTVTSNTLEVTTLGKSDANSVSALSTGVTSVYRKTADDVTSLSLDATSAIRQTANVWSRSTEVCSLIHVLDPNFIFRGLISAPVIISSDASGEYFRQREGRIILKRGPSIDLPGKPRNLARRDMNDMLDEGELAFSDDEGRLFIGADPKRDLPQKGRMAFPYENIEVIGENSSEAFSRLHGQRKREGDNYDYFASTLNPSDFESDGDSWQAQWAQVMVDDFPFAFPIGSLGAIVDYAIVGFEGRVLRQGQLEINYNVNEEIVSCIDEGDVNRPEEEDPLSPVHNPDFALRSVKFRAKPIPEGLSLEYQSFYEAPVKLRFKTSLIYFTPGRSISGFVNNAVVRISANLSGPIDQYDYRIDFTDLPTMTDDDRFTRNGETSVAGNLEFSIQTLGQIRVTQFQISSNYRPSEIGFSAWNSWVLEPTQQRYQYRWIRNDDSSGSLLIRMTPLPNSPSPNQIIGIGIGICGNRDRGGQNCNAQLYVRNQFGNDIPLDWSGPPVRNSTHSGAGIHGTIVGDWRSILFFFGINRGDLLPPGTPRA